MMFNFEIFDVVIGLVFFYLLASLLCSSIAEILESIIIRQRGKLLRQGIQELLGHHESGILLFGVEFQQEFETELNKKNIPEQLRLEFEKIKITFPQNFTPLVEKIDKCDEWQIKDKQLVYIIKKEEDKLNTYQKGDLVEKIYKHPLLFGLFRDGYDPKSRKLPSYIPSDKFALALINMVLDSQEKDWKNAIPNIKYQNIREALSALAITVEDDISNLQKSIESWYNNSMDRVSGWYKQQTQWIILILAFFASIVLNLDSIKIATELSYNETLRKAVVVQAQEMANKPIVIMPQTTGSVKLPEGTIPEFAEKIGEIKTEIDNLGLPIGWSNEGSATSQCLWQKIWKWILRIIGWSATAFAVSLGAPFWFDLLGRFIKVRSSLKPPEPDKSGKTPENNPNGQTDHTGS